MIIKETVKANVCLKAHPVGLKKLVEGYFNELQEKKSIDGAKNVLILGGSSGYGLASRIVASEKMHANTFNVCYETAPEKKRTGSAGYWNVKFFNQLSSTKSVDYNINAFLDEDRHKVVENLKKSGVKIDLVIYSLAAGAKMTPNGLVESALKPIGKDILGRTIDIGKNTIKDVSIKSATQQEIDNTVFVMGGSDWYKWIEDLSQANVLKKQCKTISYTYIGAEPTKDIYRDGTIGMAKIDLEKTVHKLNENFDVEASVVSAKAVATKASVFIPSMPIYAGCLYEVMKKQNVHESITNHIYRLFEEMIYGNSPIIDEEGRVRIDHLEMDSNIQKQTINLMKSLTNEEILNLDGTKEFINEFYQINGFRIKGIDYTKDVELETL